MNTDSKRLVGCPTILGIFANESRFFRYPEWEGTDHVARNEIRRLARLAIHVAMALPGYAVDGVVLINQSVADTRANNSPTP